MRKHRFFCNQNLELNQATLLPEPLAHHISRVLRLEVGAIIYLFNNSALEFSAQITQITKNSVTALITEATTSHTTSPLNLHLGLGIIKFDNIDLILQKACEIGVSTISLIHTEHTSIKNASLRAIEKLAHWQKVLESAAAQCWRTILPQVHIGKLEDFFIHNSAADLKLILNPQTQASYNILSDANPHHNICVLIGPEGGFSEQELIQASAQDFQALHLGPRILRTETACFCALTMLQAKFGDLLT